MPNIGQDDDDDQCHRLLIERRRGFNPSFPTLHFVNDLSSHGFSYRKLPQQLLKLSVLKLDGSSFDVYISRNSTVADLKQAIEEVFSSSPKECQGKISWSHVWGHFCLCFEGQKFINDKAYIRNFGVKDGDQLQFIRHMSINCEPTRRVSRNQTAPYKQNSISSSESNVHDGEDQTCRNEKGDHVDQEDYYKHTHYEDDDEFIVPEFKLAHFLRGWLSYSRLWSVTRKGTEGRRRPSRFALQCLGGGTEMIQL